MTNDDALKIYIEKDVQPIVSLYQDKILSYIDKNFLDIKTQFDNSFKEICKKVIKAQEHSPNLKIGYVQYSFLFSKLRFGEAVYLVEAFDDGWYFGNKLAECQISLLWLHDFIKEMNDLLIKESRKYVGKINKATVEKVLFVEVKLYKNMIPNLFKCSINDILKLNELSLLNKGEEIQINFGEYRGDFETVFIISDLSGRIWEGLDGVFLS